jgi:PAS domain S-box-containing protein
MHGAHPLTQALVSAMMHSAQPMVVSDPHQPDHPMVAVNDAFAAVTGYTRAETVGRNCRFLQGPDSDKATSDRIRRCIAERQGCIEWIVNYRRDGSKFWNLLFMVPVFDAKGALLNFFGNQRDITEGRPPDLTDHFVGKASLSTAGQREFQSLLESVLDQPDETDQDRAQGLDRIVEAARRLNAVTTQLTQPRWSPGL